MNQRHITRRHFFGLGTAVLVSPVLLSWIVKGGPSARWRIDGSGQAIGLKLSEDSRGFLMLSARELKGKKLFVIPIGKPEKEGRGNSHSSKIKLKDGSSMSLKIEDSGRVSSNVTGVKFGLMDYRPGNDNENSAQNFWDWLGDKVNDLLDGIAAGILYMNGGGANIINSNGDYIEVDGGNSTVKYRPGNSGGFKLEPGIEEEGNIWY